jgi:hypothetical protein
MRFPAAGRAPPVFPETDRQNGNPVDVPHVEGPDGDRSPRLLAREAVVIAKRDQFWPEVVGATHHNVPAGAAPRDVLRNPRRG